MDIPPEPTSDRRPHPEALAHLAAYVDLLRHPAAFGPASDGTLPAFRSRMLLKLEFEDGRWDVIEEKLEEMPSVGDSLRLADGRLSRVRAIQTVLSGRTRKPPRQIVVCTLGA